jgi:uncharacterized protein (TIGR01319 family)
VVEGAPRPSRSHALCVDFGSTFTKAALVDLGAGRIVAAAAHRTTIDTDVLDGYDACLAALVAVEPAAEDAEVLACSSAGGGLRIAVVGNEELVTAEAGRRVALSSGGKVVAVVGVASRPREGEPWAATVREAAPDVVLLTGGTDGGNAAVLLEAAAELVASGWSGPVVVAGNADARDEVAEILATGGVPHVLADNVVPRIGVLAPGSARGAIREMFLAHVIGGKHLSSRADFTAMVRGATPDIVLTGVELLARGLDGLPGAGDVVVVDVGGATTDVHSVVEPDPDNALTEDGLAREVVATTPVTRTVEGDLGLRWSAASTVAAAHEARITVADGLAAAAAARTDDPDLLPADDAAADADERLAALASGLALRRHAGRARVVLSTADDVGGAGRVVERSGKDLREVDLLVASGGIFRNGRPGVEQRVLAGLVGEVEGGWQLPRAARVVVDRDYVLAAAGLLAGTHPKAAYRLTRALVAG